ncbi:MAG: aspartate aminotransferase family protein [Cytophagales bacterium]|nr:aspartate aminotransferase family protein [Cytophagales bacterium]
MPTQRELFLQHVAQTSEFPLALEIVRAEGVYMYDVNGKKYLDLISGIGVSNVGHRHPNVVKAIKDQVDLHLHLMVYGEFVQSPQVMLAKRLSQTLPEPLDCVYFVNSGSEAVEGALKLAKRYTGRTGIISCKNAYHGATHGALSVTGDEGFKNAFRPLLPGISHIRFGELEDLELLNDQTACIIIETVQGEAGVRLATPTYFHALRKRCDDLGVLLISDEIQSGFGRTGTFWAFEQYGFVPDIVVSAKGMGGGMPIGAFMASRQMMAVFMNRPTLGHITTFGGHPVSCAASLATMETILNDHLMDHVQEKSELFGHLLVHPRILGIRRSGLMIAVEFESFEFVKRVIDRCIELGVLTDWFLFCDNSMRIAPPLTITETEIRWAAQTILDVIAEFH